MTHLTFILSLATGIAAVLVWAFRRLPSEGWQMVAAVPTTKNGAGDWSGRNLTYYGVFSANAYVIGVLLLLVLLAAAGVSIPITLLLTALLLLVCVPASRLVAVAVEHKRYTFTVAGGFFVGVLTLPVLIYSVNHLAPASWGVAVPVMPVLAATAIVYAVGEGLGRLACISFGCCYGKPLADCPAWLQKLLGGWSFTFSGETKKACYERGLAGRPLVPIQAITAVVLTTTGLVATWFYLAGSFRLALLLAITLTQLWRTTSEFLRYDFRGHQRITAYQMMAMTSVIYCFAIAWWLGPGEERAVNYCVARYLCYQLQERHLLIPYFRAFVANQKNDPEGIASLRQVLNVSDLTAFRAEWETAMIALKLPER